jgi:hypothetical protein
MCHVSSINNGPRGPAVNEFSFDAIGAPFRSVRVPGFSFVGHACLPKPFGPSAVIGASLPGGVGAPPF